MENKEWQTEAKGECFWEIYKNLEFATNLEIYHHGGFIFEKKIHITNAMVKQLKPLLYIACFTFRILNSFLEAFQTGWKIAAGCSKLAQWFGSFCLRFSTGALILNCKK
jgi:hypothetical protein